MDTPSNKSSLMSILYVDDDSNTLNILSAILTTKYPAMQMYSADNGEAGLALFKQHRPNIVITDINLHRIDGFQLATAIRRLDTIVQIIILSGHPSEQYQSRLSQIGIRHYIQKPISFDQIFTAIDDSIHLQEALIAPQDITVTYYE